MVARAKQNATIDNPPTKFDLMVGLCSVVGGITVITIASGCEHRAGMR